MARKVDAFIHRGTQLEYWNAASPDDDGMLGKMPFPQISTIDLSGSRAFLSKLRRQQSGASDGDATAEIREADRLAHVVDCGAGIGRITLGFLSTVARKVDMVEPVDKFTKEIETGDTFRALREAGRLGKVYSVGLQAFAPEPAAYDLIWNQWCLLYLKDAELVDYFRRCKEGLANGGWIVVKENLSTDKLGRDTYDEVDSSVTRTDTKYRALFKQCGLEVVATELQDDWPKNAYPVRMYALQPVH